MEEKITIGNIFRQYGEPYITKHKLKGQAKGILRLLAICQTPVLGLHYQQCNYCGHTEVFSNSCRNRHCPVCQHKNRQQWLDKRMQELLGVGYYHLVFTIPHQLNDLCLKNKKLMYNILFKAASQTVIELARDTRYLGANTGLITVLHTWGQNMMDHPHLHCIMPAGGLSFDKLHWISPCKSNDFFVYYKVLSRKFRGKFLYLLQHAYENGLLNFPSKIAALSSKRAFRTFKDQLFKKKWVVYIQKPLGHPGKILEYLGRYVFRIAITDRRIEKIEDGKVHFSMKDYRRGGLWRKMSLDIDEFIGRFLLHILPKGFSKVRYYGIFASTVRKKNIQTAKQCLNEERILRNQQDKEDGIPCWEKHETVWLEIMQAIANYIMPNCPVCKQGVMQFSGMVPKIASG